MNFDEMQDNLANWLGEAKDRNGTWDIVEKKRQINAGCLEFVIRTKFLKDVQRQKTVAEQEEYPLPNDFLNGAMLVSNGLQYFRETLERHFKFTNGAMNNASGPYRYYYIDEVKQVMILNPAPPEDDKDMSFLYIKKPNKLVENDSKSVIPEQFHQVALYWAAYQMLPKEFEQGRRGREALAAWKRGIDEALESFNHEVDGNIATAELGPEFLSHNDSLGSGDFDSVGGR